MDSTDTCADRSEDEDEESEPPTHTRQSGVFEGVRRRGSYRFGVSILRARLLGVSKTQYATRNNMRAMVYSYLDRCSECIKSSPVSALRMRALPFFGRQLILTTKTYEIGTGGNVTKGIRGEMGFNTDIRSIQIAEKIRQSCDRKKDHVNFANHPRKYVSVSKVEFPWR